MGFVFAFVVLISAQTGRSDEEQIRTLIAKYDAGQTEGMFASERIFWSGAYKRPTIGSQRGEEVPSDRQPSQRVRGSQRGKTAPVRIEVAKSGDMAYEFSQSDLSFELENGRKESLTSSILRVWKKESGQWKIAAQFSHPHYQEATIP